MKFTTSLTLLALLFSTSALSESNTNLDGNVAEEDKLTTENEISYQDVVNGKTQTCWSAKKCTGKVLSHRDKHNCKVKSHGKSWTSPQGKCSNII
ncbi:hypothetical protein AB4543_17390 [Vibrio splendidus]|jgi:hypothetical protein